MPAYEFLTLTGTIIPDTSGLLAEVQAEFRAALGADLSIDPETPQGVLITGEVQSRAAAAANNAALANQINPEIAGGVYLDALCSLLGQDRLIETRTLVRDVFVAGQPGAVIPAGSRARTDAGDVFEATGTLILPPIGSGTLDFQAVECGPVPCGSAELTNIVDSVLGWEVVNNPNAGIIGTGLQSDESLRTLRRLTLARQGLATPEAVISALYSTPDVKSLVFRENVTSSPLVIPAVITLEPHSIWACVDGGTDDDVAGALARNKTAGAGWNGLVSVIVTDPSSGQDYEVLFDRPGVIDVITRVTVRRGQFVGNILETVQNAVLEYAAGSMPGEQGFIVGGNVSPYEISGAVSRRAPSLFVTKVEVGNAVGGVYQLDEYVVPLNGVAKIEPSSITVVEVS